MSREEANERSSTAHGKGPRSKSQPQDSPRPLRLRIFPDSVLRRVCVPVDDFSSALEDLCNDMVFLMSAHEGIGLAAPQAGIERRLFVAKIEGVTISVANPVIRSLVGRDVMPEGCLSLPGQQFDIARNAAIEVEGFDTRGKRCRHTVEGFWARVMQHEIDHLNGVLIRDHAADISER
jgi:peptide deformylase